MMNVATRLGRAPFFAGFAVAALVCSTPGVSQTLDTEAAAEEAETVGQGEASYYGKEHAGKRTANGERFNPGALTAAHRTLPFGSKIRVTNKSNGKSVIVRINDRGPFTKHRIVDVSLAAANEIQMVRAGKASVKLELLR